MTYWQVSIAEGTLSTSTGKKGTALCGDVKFLQLDTAFFARA